MFYDEDDVVRELITFLKSQRGDSGSMNMRMICIKAGAAATPSIHLHVPGA